MSANRSIANHVFFENTNTIGLGKEYIVSSDASQMNLKFICSGSFQAKITADIAPKEEIFKAYPCYQIPDFTKITDIITSANYLYNIDLSAIDYLRIEILSLTGTISAYGKVVG